MCVRTACVPKTRRRTKGLGHGIWWGQEGRRKLRWTNVRPKIEKAVERVVRRNWNFLGRFCHIIFWASFGAVVWITHSWVCRAKSLYSGQEAPGIHFLLEKNCHQQTGYCELTSLSNTCRRDVSKCCSKDTAGLGTWRKHKKIILFTH